MSEKKDFLTSVRENLTQVQKTATAKVETLNGSAKKIFTEVVEKGKASQKNITVKLHETAKPAEAVLKKARTYVDSASREQAKAFAGNLRKVAARLDQIGQVPAPSESAAPQATAS